MSTRGSCACDRKRLRAERQKLATLHLHRYFFGCYHQREHFRRAGRTHNQSSNKGQRIPIKDDSSEYDDFESQSAD
jgi:hypothetical protein